jgi:hypothetical protein
MVAAPGPTKLAQREENAGAVSLGRVGIWHQERRYTGHCCWPPDTPSPLARSRPGVNAGHPPWKWKDSNLMLARPIKPSPGPPGTPKVLIKPLVTVKSGRLPAHTPHLINVVDTGFEPVSSG